MSTVHREIDLPCEPDEAWHAVTDPDELAHWLGESVTLDELEPGAPLAVTLDDGEERYGVVEEVVDGEALRFRWWNAEFQESEVEFRVSALPGGSRVSVTERLLAPAVEPLAWGPRLQALAFAPVG